MISPEYSEMREAYRRVNGLKVAAVDNQSPKTFKMGKLITENRRNNSYALEEHIKNLASLQRRICDIGSVNIF